MTLRTIQRTAIGGWLTLARLPIDTALRFAGGNAAGAKLAVDRADATARTLLGALLGDEVLQDDGARRRTAAEERERAQRLRNEAGARTEKAEQRVEERAHKAGERKRRAEADAKQRHEQAGGRRNARKSGAAKGANRRRQAAERDAAKKKQQTEERAKRDRASQLEAASAALQEREAAMTAADEGDRLGDAAARAKARRKKDG